MTFAKRLNFGLLPLLAFVIASLAPCQAAETPSSSAVVSPGDGLHLGLQCWTFRRFSVLETFKKANQLGITRLQVYRGQSLGGGLDGKMGHDMSASERETVRGWAKERGLEIVGYGVLSPGSSEEWERVIEFARFFGVHTIATEVDATTLALAAPLAKAAGIRLALHNHPTPSRYADPAFAMETVLAAGENVGICADTGHWLRSGIDPIESLRKVGPRLFELHLKDVDEPARKGRDRPFGTGAGQAARQIGVLREIGFNGTAFLEYEHDTPELESELAACVAYFRAAMAAPVPDLLIGRLAAPGYTLDPSPSALPLPASSDAGWEKPSPLFTGDLSNAEFDSTNWSIEDGVISSKGKSGYLWSSEDYGDFSLSLEFRLPKGGNSGIFIRTSDLADPVQNSIEVQLLQGDAENPSHVVGSLFDIVPATRRRDIKPGEWHQLVVRAIGTYVEVWVDRERVVTAKLEQWTTPNANPDGTRNKFSKAIGSLPQTGRIGLQDHGAPVSFRNLLIEKP